jgi:exonuclease VII small subunit
MFMNEVRVEDEPLQEFEENANVWKEGSKNLEKNEQKMKEILKKVHAQRLFWNQHSKNVLCWAFFYV